MWFYQSCTATFPTSAWVFSCKSAAYFQNIFSVQHLWRTASGSTQFSARIYLNWSLATPDLFPMFTKSINFDTFQFLQFCQILKSTDVQKMWFINSTSVLLSFSWTEPQIWLSCYLIHIGITILRHFLYSLYLCPCLGLQSVTKYLRLTLVFMWKSAPQEKFNRYFSGLFC